MRFINPALAIAAATTLAACGAAEGPAAADISPTAAKTNVERSAHVRLAPHPVPAEARDEGLVRAFSNARTAARDRQAVVVLLLKDARVAGKVGDWVRGSAPERSRVLVKRNVMVVYAAAGQNRARQVERALQRL